MNQPIPSLLKLWIALALLVSNPFLRAADVAPEPPRAPSSPTPPSPPEPPALPDDDPVPPDADEPPPVPIDGEVEEDADWEVGVERKRDRMQEIVEFGKRVHLGTNETAPVVVVFFENAEIHGQAGEVVVIGGTAEIYGRVRHQVVAVLGKVKLGPSASVGGQVVGIGGGVERAKGSKVRGQVVSIPLPGIGEVLEMPEFLKRAFTQLVLKLRPLSFNVPWSWALFGTLVLVSILLTALFPGGMARTVQTLDSRPVGSFFMGLASFPLGMILALLLAATGIGLLGWPILFATAVMATIFGKAALVGHFGAAISKQFGLSRIPPAIAVVIGSALLASLYLIPFLGFITWMIVTAWGMGAALLALFAGLRDEYPASPPVAAATTATTPVPTPTSAFAHATPFSNAGALGTTGPDATESSRPDILPPSAPEALTQLRAGFWRKAGAAAIDVAVLLFVTGVFLPQGFLLWIAYFAAMWTWKGTTIGGLVFGLRVVRLDGRPVDVATAIVRALGGALGSAMCFLGLLWCAWDPEKQGWHDRMAGTVVVRTDAAQPLV